MKQKIAYLTIDDAPVVDMNHRVDFLNSHNIQAIWFCQGNLMEEFPEQAIYAIKQGHVLGNHSFDHPDFSTLNLDQARDQITRTDRLIEIIYSQAEITRPIKVFRFPYLNKGAPDDEKGNTPWEHPHVKALQDILREEGYRQPLFENISYRWYKEAGWDRSLNLDCSYDSFDWTIPGDQEMLGYHDLPTVLARMDEDFPEQRRGLNYRGSNDIVMMHAFVDFQDFQKLVNRIEEKNILMSPTSYHAFSSNRCNSHRIQ